MDEYSMNTYFDYIFGCCLKPKNIHIHVDITELVIPEDKDLLREQMDMQQEDNAGILLRNIYEDELYEKISRRRIYEDERREAENIQRKKEKLYYHKYLTNDSHRRITDSLCYTYPDNIDEELNRKIEEDERREKENIRRNKEDEQRKKQFQRRKQEVRTIQVKPCKNEKYKTAYIQRKYRIEKIRKTFQELESKLERLEILEMFAEDHR
jgi:hypothetical protein